MHFITLQINTVKSLSANVVEKDGSPSFVEMTVDMIVSTQDGPMGENDGKVVP